MSTTFHDMALPLVEQRAVEASALVLAHHARTFALAARFLPADRRDDAAVLYAVCRAIDDAADEAVDSAAALEALTSLRRQIVGRDRPSPLIAAFHGVVDRCGMTTEPILLLADAAASDVGPVRVADDRALLRYAYGVAGTVGLMMCGVLGVHDPRAHAHAVDLGIGMQLTNICRDVAEDAERGRVYLPADRLAAAGTSSEALLRGTADPEAVSRVVRDLLALADRYYASGEAGLRYLPLRSRLAILVASRCYRAIGRVLLRRGGDPLAGRTVVASPRKGVEVLLALAALPLLPRRPHDAGLHTALVGLPGADAEAA